MFLPVLSRQCSGIEQVGMGGDMFKFENKHKTGILQICMAAVLMYSMIMLSFTPVSADATTSGSTCDTEYVVQWGDNLYRIGLRFGVSWPDIAANNGIAYPYWVYAGQTICISGPAGSAFESSGTGVSIFIDNHVINKSVTIETSRLPRREIFDVTIGSCPSTGIGGINVGKIKTDGNPGVYREKFTIPSAFHGVSCLAIRITSRVTTRTAYATFSNGSGVVVPPVTSTIDFKVTSVLRNKTVTIAVTNAIPGKKYRVFIDWAGHGAAGGTLVATFVSNHSNFTDNYTIPLKYKGEAKLDLRIEGVTTTALVVHTFSNTTH